MIIIYNLLLVLLCYLHRCRRESGACGIWGPLVMYGGWVLQTRGGAGGGEPLAPWWVLADCAFPRRTCCWGRSGRTRESPDTAPPSPPIRHGTSTATLCREARPPPAVNIPPQCPHTPPSVSTRPPPVSTPAIPSVHTPPLPVSTPPHPTVHPPHPPSPVSTPATTTVQPPTPSLHTCHTQCHTPPLPLSTPPHPTVHPSTPIRPNFVHYNYYVIYYGWRYNHND